MPGIRDYVIVPIRSEAVLTGSYVAATTLSDGAAVNGIRLQPHLSNQLILLVKFTLGSLTSAEIKIELSPDNTTFYQESVGTVSGGEETVSLLNYKFTATGNYRIPLPITDRHIKISAKGTGTVTGSLLQIDAMVGVN